MTEEPRVSNWAILAVLVLAYVIPSFFIKPNMMLDIVSVPMLVFGIYGLYILGGETIAAMNAKSRDRAALGLFGLFALLLSVVIMRPYGILTRNVTAASWLSDTHAFAFALYLQAIGLWLFTRASAAPYVPAKHSSWGQLIIGIIIGALIASSRWLEMGLIGVGKIFGRLF